MSPLQRSIRQLTATTLATACATVLLATWPAVAPQTARAQQTAYVCTPCGAPCDAKKFDKPGICPACGMALISEEDARQLLESSGPRGKVAILIFDGVQIIDYTGPYEIFGAAEFDVYTVARTKNPVTTTMGMTVVPKFSFGDAPPPDVLVIPGGGVRGVETDSVTLDWIRNTSGHTSTTMSVCNGAFILARAGLLDGLSATTTNGNLAALREQFPRVTVVDDKRYVDNGKIITTAGLSAGIDGALHVVSRIQGIGAAEQTALAEEYPWHEGREYVRAALAENLIPIGNIPGEYGRWNVETTNGDTKRWELVLTGRSQKTAPELDKFFESRCTGKGWKRVSAAPGSGGTEWSFTGPGDAVWHGILSIQPARSKTNEYLVRISIARAGLD